MDPNAAYRMMNEHLKAGDYSEAYDIAIGLIEWVKNGGFLPRGISKQGLYYSTRMTIDLCKPFIEV